MRTNVVARRPPAWPRGRGRTIHDPRFDLHEARIDAAAHQRLDVALCLCGKRIGVEAAGDDRHARSARHARRVAQTATRSAATPVVALAQPARDVARA